MSVYSMAGKNDVLLRKAVVIMCTKVEDLINAAKAGSNELRKYAKTNDILAAVKLDELLGKKEEEKKKANPVVVALAVVGAVAAVAAIAYAVYCYFTPKYMDDFEDDYGDDFEDDFFEDEEDDDKDEE